MVEFNKILHLLRFVDGNFPENSHPREGCWRMVSRAAVLIASTWHYDWGWHEQDSPKKGRLANLLHLSNESGL